MDILKTPTLEPMLFVHRQTAVLPTAPPKLLLSKEYRKTYSIDMD